MSRFLPERIKKEWALFSGIYPGMSRAVSCWWCPSKGSVAWASRVRLSPNFEWDHLHPASRGGRDDAENLDPICMRCNRRKGARTVDEFDAYLRASGDPHYPWWSQQCQAG